MFSSTGPFDFHAHGGDVSRTVEIAEYLRDEELSGLCLLSLPLAGYPGLVGGPPHMNDAVLESKRLLADMTEFPVYAFGCLDNRDLLGEIRGDGQSLERRSPAEQVAELHQVGFDGLKLWEGKPSLAASLGMMPHHPRLVEACREAGRLGMPVIFHVADPPEFWGHGRRDTPFAAGMPDFDALIEGAALLCGKAPDASIVFPHLLFLAGDLERASSFLDESPNAFLDLAPGNYAYEPLAIHRDSAAAFFSAYSKRILFGSDAFFFAVDNPALAGDSLEGNRRRCSRLREFLSGNGVVDNPYPFTSDQGRNVRGLELSGSVLADIFWNNARRLLARAPREVMI